MPRTRATLATTATRRFMRRLLRRLGMGPTHCIGAPATVLRDLKLALAEGGLAEDTQDFAAVLERDLADAEPGRLLHEDVGESRRRYVPDLDRDGRAAGRDAQHRRVAVPDRPQPIDRRGSRLAHEARAGVDEVAVEREPAHQRPVNGEEQNRPPRDRG